MNRIITVTAAVFFLSLVGCNDGKGDFASNSGSSSATFSNSFGGSFALRDSSNNLVGEFATISFNSGTNGEISGTISVGQDSALVLEIDEAGSVYDKEPQTDGIAVDLDIPGFGFQGQLSLEDGTFVASGNGLNGSGEAVTIDLQGTIRQLGTAQIAESDIVLTVGASSVDGATQFNGQGTLPGQNRVDPPSGVSLPPILTAPIQIPRGVTVRFAPTGMAAVANPDQTETGDIVNFSIPNYNATGFDGFSNISSGGWFFDFDGQLFTVRVPMTAPIASGYTVRDRSSGMDVSAGFEVIDCPLQTFTGTNFIGGTIRAHVDFFDSLQAIDTAAGEANVKVFITSSFREAGATLQGTVVPPATRSNHLVGHAIDMNVQYTDPMTNTTVLCNSTCLSGTLPAPVQDFIDRVRASGLRWGGDFVPRDVVHFDDHFNASADDYDRRYGIMQQCAQLGGN